MSRRCNPCSFTWQKDGNHGFSDKGHDLVQQACPVPMDKGPQRLKLVAGAMNLKLTKHPEYLCQTQVLKMLGTRSRSGSHSEEAHNAIEFLLTSRAIDA